MSWSTLRNTHLCICTIFNCIFLVISCHWFDSHEKVHVIDPRVNTCNVHIYVWMFKNLAVVIVF